jgi:imidazolonepropionase-like amidohydrolase
MRHLLRPLACCAVLLPAGLAAQRPTLGNAVRPFISVDAPVVAFTDARVIDGTGAPAREAQTVLVRDGRIVAMGPTASTAVPSDAQRVDLRGKTLLPGLVMVHEHLYYPTGNGTYGNLTESFARLYLAGGVTAMRTGGNTNGYGELAMRDAVNRGDKAGPWIDATAPYLQQAGLGIGQMYALKDAEDARRMVRFWADAGATSFKAYMHVSRDVLAAAIDEVHGRGLKITGHLCSVTLAEAAALGIDNVEHAFFAATDFVADKQPDVCPGQAVGQRALAQVTPEDPRFQTLVRTLIDRRVALTSTLPVFETFTPGRPLPPGLEVLTPQLRELYEARHAATQRNNNSIYATLYPRAAALEVAFARAGGLLIAGTDPTGGGGVIAGFSNQRTIALLVEAGFTLPEAVRIVTLNGATYLGIADRTGSIAVGKQADLIVMDGDPGSDLSAVHRVSLVMKQGVGYDPARLIASVAGRVGLF